MLMSDRAWVLYKFQVIVFPPFTLGSIIIPGKWLIIDCSIFPLLKFPAKSGMLVLYKPESRISEPRFSEILDLMNKLELPFLYCTLYPDSI